MRVLARLEVVVGIILMEVQESWLCGMTVTSESPVYPTESRAEQQVRTSYLRDMLRCY